MYSYNISVIIPICTTSFAVQCANCFCSEVKTSRREVCLSVSSSEAAARCDINE